MDSGLVNESINDPVKVGPLELKGGSLLSRAKDPHILRGKRAVLHEKDRFDPTNHLTVRKGYELGARGKDSVVPEPQILLIMITFPSKDTSMNINGRLSSSLRAFFLAASF